MFLLQREVTKLEHVELLALQQLAMFIGTGCIAQVQMRMIEQYTGKKELRQRIRPITTIIIRTLGRLRVPTPILLLMETGLKMIGTILGTKYLTELLMQTVRVRITGIALRSIVPVIQMRRSIIHILALVKARPGRQRTIFLISKNRLLLPKRLRKRKLHTIICSPI